MTIDSLDTILYTLSFVAQGFIFYGILVAGEGVKVTPIVKILLAKSAGGLPPVCASSKLGRFDV